MILFIFVFSMTALVLSPSPRRSGRGSFKPKLSKELENSRPPIPSSII